MAALELWPNWDSQVFALTSTGAEATTATGLAVGTNSSSELPYKEFRTGEERGTSGWGGTALPIGNPEAQNTKNTIWTPEAMTKTFKAEVWPVVVKVICTVAAEAKGQMRLRLWKSPDKTTTFTALTSSISLSETGNLVTGSSAETKGNLEPGAVTLTNEYIGLQLAWKITHTATSATANVRLRKGSEVKLTTAAEEVATGSVGSLMLMGVGQ
ncbi:MAG: hypothetical protein JSS68_15055 [Actinobacteria bacterium]|nr:hypothetical protein [Actinomycetota bacterium]